MATKLASKHKKTWFSIMSPNEFGNYVIGETPVSEPQQLLERNIQVNLMSLLNDPKKQNVQLTFKIKNVREKSATTEIMRYDLSPSYLKRLMRGGRDKVEDSFVVEMKDSMKVRVKPFLITKTQTQRSKLSLIKKTVREFLIERAKTQNISELINNAVSTKIQRELREKIKKIYPLAICEFKAILVE